MSPTDGSLPEGADDLLVFAGSLITGVAVGTGVIGGEKRTNDELPRLDRSDSAADLLNDAAVLVTHRGRQTRTRRWPTS